MLRSKIVLAILIIVFFASCSHRKDIKLTSLCGFDFSKMTWNIFNEDEIIKHYGIGCGYEADAPARKHVFYDNKSGLWLQFDIIENDKWLVGVEASKKPLCNIKVQPLKDITSCGLSKGLGINDSVEEIKKIYGEGQIALDKIQYHYEDIEVGADVYFDKKNMITGYKVFSLVP